MARNGIAKLWVIFIFKKGMPHFPLEVIVTFLQTYKLMYKGYLFSHPHQQFRSKTSFFFFSSSMDVK